MDVEIVESKAVTPVQLEAWQQLFDSAPDSRFYHHPHWFYCIAEHLLTSQLNLCFVYIGEQLQMVLPLCNPTRLGQLSHPEHDHLSLNDVLVHPSLTNDVNKLLKAIELSLNDDNSNWWTCRVTNIPHHSSLMQSLVASVSAKAQVDAPTLNLQTHCDNRIQSWLFKKTRQSASFECTGEQRAPHGKLRRNLRRLRKQMLECGQIRVDVIVEPGLLKDAYQHFLKIEASGWKGTGDKAPAIQANPELLAFYQSLLKPLTSGFDPQINLLWCGDVCVAAQFGIRTGACLSLLKIGYNEDYARFSPGYLLLESILNETPTQNIKTLSLVTSPPWADRWHPDTVPVWQLSHYNNSPFGTALHMFDQFKQVAKNRLKQAA